jgi:hypothetical protein
MEETDTDKLVKALNGVASLGYPIDRLKDSIEKLIETLQAGQRNDRRVRLLGDPESAGDKFAVGRLAFGERQNSRRQFQDPQRLANRTVPFFMLG